MLYGITRLATDFNEEKMSNWRIRLIGALFFFIPRANPDNERHYPKVSVWALELSDDGWPQREVGLDAQGKPLFRAPDDRNTGFWPDMAYRQFAPGELNTCRKRPSMRCGRWQVETTDDSSACGVN